MSVRQPGSNACEQARIEARASAAARPRRGDPHPAVLQHPHGNRRAEAILAVDSSLSAQTPVSAAEVDAIIRLLGDDLDLILGGEKSS